MFRIEEKQRGPNPLGNVHVDIEIGTFEGGPWRRSTAGDSAFWTKRERGDEEGLDGAAYESNLTRGVMCDQGYDLDDAKAALEEARDELGDDAPSTLYFSPRLDVIVDRRLSMYRWWHQTERHRSSWALGAGELGAVP